MGAIRRLCLTLLGLSVALGTSVGWAQPEFQILGPFPVEGYTASIEGNGPQMATRDFNEDGHLDIAVSASIDDAVKILLGNGRGGFSSFTTSPVGEHPRSIVAGDVNADDHLDLLTANRISEDVSVLLGDGMGSFSAAPSVPVGETWGVALLDVNEDLLPDLFATEFNPTSGAPGSVHLYLNTGGGSFAFLASYTVGVNPVELRVADLNADGVPDVAVTCMGVSPGAFGGIFILYGDGLGGFVVDQIPGVLGHFTNLEIADLNHDGHLDLAIYGFTDIGCFTMLFVLQGDSAGNWSTLFGDFPDCGPVYFATGDFELDGSNDLVSTNTGPGSGELWIYLDGMPGPLEVSVGTKPADLVAGDFNEDTQLDLAVMDTAEDGIFVLLNGVTDPPFVRGDANADGTINLADPIFNLNYQFSGGPSFCLEAQDTNDDGTVNIADPVYNLTYQFKMGPPPPAPFSNCGPDATADALGCESYSACP